VATASYATFVSTYSTYCYMRCQDEAWVFNSV
jgi:hypothetical protein